jgi:hypothetical protein
MLESMGTRILDRFVPAIEASAGAQACWTEWRCVVGTSGCNATNHKWWQTRTACDDGSTTPWAYYGCANCR